MPLLQNGTAFYWIDNDQLGDSGVKLIILGVGEAPSYQGRPRGDLLFVCLYVCGRCDFEIARATEIKQ